MTLKGAIEITFISALFHWLKQFTDEGGEEPRVPRENPDDVSEILTKPQNSNVKPVH